MRVIITGLANDGGEWELPGSIVNTDRQGGGGEQSLCELAVAAAATGREVELRGLVYRRTVDELAEAGGARPILGLPPRRPERGDLVILPEGLPDPRAYAKVMLSEARGVVLMLGPPGLVGWPFVPEWSLPDTATIPPEDVARPEHFRGMTGCGFVLWTNNEKLAAAARDAGTACTWIGVGWPAIPDIVQDKEVDVVVAGFNRWAPLAKEVLAQLDVSRDVVPALDRADFLERLGRGRILVLPSRIEGVSRIQCEARAMGTVPVALGSNPYALGLTEECGAVLADSVEEMPRKVEALLNDPGRLARLSRAGAASVRQQVDWSAYVRRVDAALTALENEKEDGGGGARAGMARAVARQEALFRQELSRSAASLGGLRAAGLQRATLRDARRLILRAPCIRPLVRMVRRSPTRYRRPARVLVVPGALHDPDYTIRRALEHVGAEVYADVRPDVVYDLVLGWHDPGWRTPGLAVRPPDVCLALAAVLREAVGRRYWNCSLEMGVSKEALSAAFRDALVPGGSAAPAPGIGPDADRRTGPAPQWRVTVIERRPLAALECISGGSADTGLVEPDEIFSRAEQEAIGRFCESLQVDYCEMGMLRDGKQGLRVEDVNLTPLLRPDSGAGDAVVARIADVLDPLLV